MATKKKPTIESLILPKDAFLDIASSDGKPKSLPRKMIAGTFPYEDVQGKLVGGALRFQCRSRLFSRLCFNRVPVSARNLAYFFSGIQWTAGKGWPVYSERC